MFPDDDTARLSVSISNGMSVDMRLGLKEVRIGRSRECELLLPDPTVSRLHARVFRVGHQYFLADTSRNGTHVDGKRITQVLLESGRIFRIGPYQIHFLRETLADPPLDPPTAAEGSREEAGRSGTVIRPAPPGPFALPGFVGSSRVIVKLLEDVHRVAVSDLPVLVEGNTGSGKELVSRGIHEASPRKERPFVVVNCGAISPDLIESELFGHEKGAFTGATVQRRGAFELAHGGTIFLDEIGELPLPLQPKLLRILEQKEIKRVGGNETILVDVRVLAATNRNLREEMLRKTFRDDLYFRLGAVTLHVPALRERREDIVPLALHFLSETSARLGRPAPFLSTKAAEFLSAYDWTGNVRELRNAVQRAIVMSGADTLGPEDFSFLVPGSDSCREPVDDNAQTRWEQSERNNILAELSRQGWNKTRAARELGIAKSTLFEKLKKYGIRSPKIDR